MLPFHIEVECRTSDGSLRICTDSSERTIASIDATCLRAATHAAWKCGYTDGSHVQYICNALRAGIPAYVSGNGWDLVLEPTRVSTLASA